MFAYPRERLQPDQIYSAPETFDIVPNAIGTLSRKNLSEISKMLTQITSGQLFGEENPCLMPLNSYVEEAIKQMNTWFMEGLLLN